MMEQFCTDFKSKITYQESDILVIGATFYYMPDVERWSVIDPNYKAIGHEPDKICWDQLEVNIDWSDADNKNDFKKYFEKIKEHFKQTFDFIFFDSGTLKHIKNIETFCIQLNNIFGNEKTIFVIDNGYLYSKGINIKEIFSNEYYDYKRMINNLDLLPNETNPYEGREGTWVIISPKNINDNNNDNNLPPPYNNQSGGKRNRYKNIRKHQGIIQSGKNKGKLKKGYKYSGNKLKSGLPQIIKVKSKK